MAARDRRKGLRARLQGVAGMAAATLAITLATGACGSRGASFPDGDRVEAAQAKWCAMLAELLAPEGQAASWDARSSCEGTYPTSSAEFLAKMTGCFQKLARQATEGAIDPGQLVADCTEQILVDFGAGGDIDGLEIVQARCERTARCQPVTKQECLDGFEGLRPSERARLTVMYNWGAQDDIAGCLGSGGCADDEDAAMIACYEESLAERVWLPELD